MQIPELAEGVKSQTTSFQKHLPVTGGSYLHTNTVTVSRITSDLKHDEPLVSRTTDQEDHHIITNKM